MKKYIRPITVALITVSVVMSLTSAKKQEVAPSYAWTLLEPLGMRETSTIDTTLYNYYLSCVPSARSAAYATTGGYGAPGKNMIYFEQKPVSDFFFRDALREWLPTVGNHKFYNTRIPMTLLSYTTGFSKTDTQDHLQAIFSGNVNEHLQIGAQLGYIYSKGSYDFQAVDDLSWGVSGSYISDHWDLQTFFNHYNSVNKESGGITDDRYITDPAELQGGSSKINPKTIPTYLTGSHSRVKGQEYYLNNRYKFGYREEIEVPDSLLTEADTVPPTRFVPVMSIAWTLDYRDSRHVFDNTNTQQSAEYWANRYITTGRTHDNTSYWQLGNTIGVSMVEGFKPWVKFGLSAFATHELLRYRQTPDSLPPGTTPLPEGIAGYPYPTAIPGSKYENRLWVGAQLVKEKGKLLRYEATGRVSMIDRTAGDIDIHGNIQVRIPMLRDTLAIWGYADFTNREAPYLLDRYVSNHFIWKNNFGKTRNLRLGGKLNFPRSRTALDIGVENTQNHIYFNANSLPAQYAGSIQVFSAQLRQDFKVGILHWDNRLTYQTSSKPEILPLPQFAVYSNLYLLFRIAKVLHVQFGVDCDYYTSYYAPAYQPATMTFCNQHTQKIGNYPFMNLYANMKLSKTRFFVMFSHVNQGLTGRNYFAMPHYPLNPRRFQVGVSIDFAN